MVRVQIQSLGQLWGCCLQEDPMEPVQSVSAAVLGQVYHGVGALGVGGSGDWVLEFGYRILGHFGAQA